MDIDLREDALTRITDTHAVELYDSLVHQYEGCYGPLDRSAQLLIETIAQAEQQKTACSEDIAKNGVMEWFVQGRQKVRRENPSVRMARSLCETQRKALNELKLTPASQKAQPESPDDTFELF